jgi:hypothetical protein
MQSPMHDLATGTILERLPTFDVDFSGTVLSSRASFVATNKGPQRGQSLAKPKPETLAEKMFEATAAAKVWTSYVAMRLDRETRDRFFRQLDRLHDIEEWIDDGKPLNIASYKTFVRAILSLKLDERPGLALMTNGNLLGTWSRGASKLSIEFRANDVVRWVVAEPGDGRTDRIAGDTGLSRLKEELMLRGAEKWFS